MVAQPRFNIPYTREILFKMRLSPDSKGLQMMCVLYMDDNDVPV